MMNTSIVGTVKSIDTVAVNDDESLSYYISLYDYIHWFITTDNETFPDSKNLKEGEKYLFIGNLTCWSPRISAQKIMYYLSKSNEDKLKGNIISVQGEISDVGFWRGHRGILESVSFKLKHTGCISTVDVVINLHPDLTAEFKHKYKNNKEITVIGKFETQEPQFNIKSATLCG